MSKSKARAKKRRKERKVLRHEVTHNMNTVNEKEKIKRVAMV